MKPFEDSLTGIALHNERTDMPPKARDANMLLFVRWVISQPWYSADVEAVLKDVADGNVAHRDNAMAAMALGFSAGVDLGREAHTASLGTAVQALPPAGGRFREKAIGCVSRANKAAKMLEGHLREELGLTDEEIGQTVTYDTRGYPTVMGPENIRLYNFILKRM